MKPSAVEKKCQRESILMYVRNAPYIIFLWHSLPTGEGRGGAMEGCGGALEGCSGAPYFILCSI